MYHTSSPLICNPFEFKGSAVKQLEQLTESCFCQTKTYSTCLILNRLKLFDQQGHITAKVESITNSAVQCNLTYCIYIVSSAEELIS